MQAHMSVPKTMFPDLFPLFGGVAFALAASGLTIVVLLRVRATLPQDVPNDRSLHGAPLPRGGGIAIWAGWLPVALWASPLADVGMATWLIPWLLLVLVSLRDDVRALGVGVRLVVHALAALWFAIALGWPSVSAVSWPAALLVAAAVGAIVAWSLNLYNFMDGNDGLAAAMAILGFSAYGVGAVIDGFSGCGVRALAGGGRQLARVVPRARVPAVHRGRDDHACAPRVAPGKGLGGPSQPLLSAAAPFGRRASRYARDLRLLDGGQRPHGTRVPAVGTRAGLAGILRLVRRGCGVFRGD
jgi:hypothetical protein